MNNRIAWPNPLSRKLGSDVMEGNFLWILDNGHGIDTPKKSYKIVVRNV